MENCLHCSKELIHVPGRRKKSFCDVNCRNKYFYSKRKKEIEAARALLVPLPSDYVMFKKVSAVTKDGVIQQISTSGKKVSDLTRPTGILKPQERPMTNYSINTAAPQVAAANDNPQRMDIVDKITAIRAEKCPKERDTPLGRKSWELEQNKRITELKSQLK